MAESSAFALLDERIQRYIWREGWTELRDAQEQAIPLVLPANRDVIIAAATAAGKTEAAFLPALTYLLREEPCTGLIAYISPLKALINDQFGRLDRLCEHLEIPVWPWHGDISASRKSRFIEDPKGILLITPESVEALLCNRGTAVANTFRRIAYFVIDELHAFIGSERGKQLQSVLHRIEKAIVRSVPRIGLSATLGDMKLAAEYLRPGHGESVALVQSQSAHALLRILVKGFEEPVQERTESLTNIDGKDEGESVASKQVAAHLFKALRGTNNLVFPNSRREVERYTHLLTKLCSGAQVPNEFWAHHGSLSKDLRSEAEAALKQQDRPATAVCTNTLELGIDIGAVRSVVQIGPPPSVASLRQRLGRSGRRIGEPAILLGYCIEEALTEQSDWASRLRLKTVHAAAMISLLLEGWIEPPRSHGLHLSTLVQQLLSLVAQYGGIQPGQAYSMLCGAGAPFQGLGSEDFKSLLRNLGIKEILMQDGSGVLLHGRVGEKLVNHYTFYAAFASDEEFRIVSGTNPLGSIPVNQMLILGQHIVFSGRTWRVDAVSEEDKTIYVSPAAGGAPPPFFGGGGWVHTKVRQRMRELLIGSTPVPFLDQTANRFLQEARRLFAQMDLENRVFLDRGTEIIVLTWLGDPANEAICCMLKRRGINAWPAGPAVEVSKGLHSLEDVKDVLADVAIDEAPPIDLLLQGAKNLEREKWDWTLPQPLLQQAYASLHLDIEEAVRWTRGLGTRQ